MVACHENGKESAMRLIKHFSSECKEDWKKESCLVNELGETEHPNILTYCWHCKGMCSAACLKNVLEKLIHVWGCAFAVVSWGNSEKNPSARARNGNYDIPIMPNHPLCLGREAGKRHSFNLIVSLFS